MQEKYVDTGNKTEVKTQGAWFVIPAEAENATYLREGSVKAEAVRGPVTVEKMEQKFLIIGGFPDVFTGDGSSFPLKVSIENGILVAKFLADASKTVSQQIGLTEEGLKIAFGQLLADKSAEVIILKIQGGAVIIDQAKMTVEVMEDVDLGKNLRFVGQTIWTETKTNKSFIAGSKASDDGNEPTIIHVGNIDTRGAAIVLGNVISFENLNLGVRVPADKRSVGLDDEDLVEGSRYNFLGDFRGAARNFNSNLIDVTQTIGNDGERLKPSSSARFEFSAVAGDTVLVDGDGEFALVGNSAGVGEEGNQVLPVGCLVKIMDKNSGSMNLGILFSQDGQVYELKTVSDGAEVAKAQHLKADDGANLSGLKNIRVSWHDESGEFRFTIKGDEGSLAFAHYKNGILTLE